MAYNCKKPITSIWDLRNSLVSTFLLRWTITVYADPTSHVGLDRVRQTKLYCRRPGSCRAAVKQVRRLWNLAGVDQLGLAVSSGISSSYITSSVMNQSAVFITASSVRTGNSWWIPLRLAAASATSPRPAADTRPDGIQPQPLKCWIVPQHLTRRN